jgi:hypothetical protein
MFEIVILRGVVYVTISSRASHPFDFAQGDTLLINKHFQK